MIGPPYLGLLATTVTLLLATTKGAHTKDNILLCLGVGMFTKEGFSKYPVITLVVNTHPGRGKFLDRCLDSVVSQTYQDFEVVLVCDGPLDKDNIRAIDKHGPRLEARGVALYPFATEEQSGGQSVPKNVGMDHAKGDYISFADSDNVLLPNKLADLMEGMEDDELFPDIVYGRRCYVNDGGIKGPNDVALPSGDSHFIQWSPQVQEWFNSSWRNNIMDIGDVLMTRGAVWMCIYATGMAMNPEQRRAADYEFFCRAINFAGLKCKGVDKVVQEYHWHGDQLQLTRPFNEGVTAKEV